MIIIFGLLALFGALFLFTCAAVLATSSWSSFVLSASVLALAWWLAGKDWGVAKAFRAADLRRERGLKGRWGQPSPSDSVAQSTASSRSSAGR